MNTVTVDMRDEATWTRMKAASELVIDLLRDNLPNPMEQVLVLTMIIDGIQKANHFKIQEIQRIDMGNA